jgi:hypothetical protein
MYLTTTSPVTGTFHASRVQTSGKCRYRSLAKSQITVQQKALMHSCDLELYRRTLIGCFYGVEGKFGALGADGSASIESLVTYGIQY